MNKRDSGCQRYVADTVYVLHTLGTYQPLKQRRRDPPVQAPLQHRILPDRRQRRELGIFRAAEQNEVANGENVPHININHVLSGIG